MANLMKIDIYNYVKKDTLRHRETAKRILKVINEISRTEPIMLDFIGINFASRSFIHEFFSGLENRNVKSLNMNSEIELMTKISFKKPKLKLKTKRELKKLIPA